MPQTEVPPNVVTGVSRPDSTPLSIIVPNLTNSNHPYLNSTPYSVQPNASQPQTIPTNPKPASLMAPQIANSESSSRFIVPANYIFPKLSSCSFVTTRCSGQNLNTSQSATQGFSRAPNVSCDTTATAPQVIPVTCVVTVYYLNSSTGPNLVGGAMPSNVSSTAPMSFGVPAVVHAWLSATPWPEPTAFTVHDSTQLMISSRKNHLTV